MRNAIVGMVGVGLGFLLAACGETAPGLGDDSEGAAGSGENGSGSGSGPSSGATGGTTAPPPPGTTTYYQHAKPILDAKCGSCHVPGGLAPFPLQTFEEVAAYGPAIAAAVEAKRMPPWLAAGGCNEYVGDRSLDADQIATIVKFVGDGLYRGDPEAEGVPLEIAMPALTRVDQTLEMPTEYTPQGAPDDYRCFPIDWPADAAPYVTGFNAKPGNPAVVHHVIAFYVKPDLVADVDALDAAEPGPGYTCYAGPNVQAGWIGGWAPGSKGSDFPPGTGLKMEPGSKVVLQVHYNTLAAGPLPDRTAIEVRTDASVEQEGIVQPWANPAWLNGDAMLIPAHSADVEHDFAMPPSLVTGGKDLTIHSVALHMHTLGKSGRVEVEREDGTRECLLDVPAWNFHWQGSYGLKTPVTLRPKDKLRVACTWDNPTDADVTWGEGTSDEMCLTAFYGVPQ